MRRFLLSLAVLSVLAIVAWWPFADRFMPGPRTVTHFIIPVGLALVALLFWRMLRSLAAALLCAGGIALVVLLIYVQFADQIRPLLERILP